MTIVTRYDNGEVDQTETRPLLAWFRECTLQRNATPANVLRFLTIRRSIIDQLQIGLEAFYHWLYRVQKYKPEVNRP